MEAERKSKGYGSISNKITDGVLNENIDSDDSEKWKVLSLLLLCEDKVIIIPRQGE